MMLWRISIRGRAAGEPTDFSVAYSFLLNRGHRHMPDHISRIKFVGVRACRYVYEGEHDVVF